VKREGGECPINWMLVVGERAAVDNERTLIPAGDINASHPEDGAHIDEQRVTLCADLCVISYGHRLEHSSLIPRGVAAIHCKAPRDITALKTARRTQREGALEMVFETLHYQMIVGDTI